MSLKNLDLTYIMAVNAEPGEELGTDIVSKAEPGMGINQAYEPPPPKAPQSEIVLQAGPGEQSGPAGGTPPLTPYIPRPGGGGGKSLPRIDFE